MIGDAADLAELQGYRTRLGRIAVDHPDVFDAAWALGALDVLDHVLGLNLAEALPGAIAYIEQQRARAGAPGEQCGEPVTPELRCWLPAGHDGRHGHHMVGRGAQRRAERLRGT